VCPTPKQLNVEIQEIQVNIKRRNYVNQKSKHNWQLGSHKSYRLYLYIFFVVSVFFSFCKGVLVIIKKNIVRKREKNYCRAVQAKNGPAERRLLPSKVWAAAAAAAAAKLPNSQSH